MLNPVIVMYEPVLLASACFWISLSRHSDKKDADQQLLFILPDLKERSLVLGSIVPYILSLYKDIHEDQLANLLKVN